MARLRVGWLGLDRLFLGLLRRFLFVWAKTTVLPERLSALHTLPGPLFYVLETPALASLLVLEQECAAAGLPLPGAPFHLAELKLPRAAGSVVGLQRSGRLAALTALLRADPQRDVQLIPVAVFWGQTPERERSWFKVLFADTWALTGWLKRFFTVLIHSRNIWIRFSKPLSLREFLNTEAARERPADRLALLLRVHFRQQRRAMLGPDLSHRRTLLGTVLQSPTVRQAIRHEAATQGWSEARAAQLAQTFADEIAADMSYVFVVLLRRVLRRLWDSLYDGVHVAHIERLHDLAPGHELVYVPCHRSHIDYLLLSYVLYQHGLALPHVAAGINLNLPLVGPLLRRGGAFFLRRSFRGFKGERLYSAVFHEYLAALLVRGSPLEYFIEGGRSRSGRSLAPKVGMLDMTVRSALRAPERPLAFVPVYIGYEKLIEGSRYASELAGAPKKKETLLGFFRSLKALRGYFGRVYLAIGEPLRLADWLEDYQPDWRQTITDGERPDWLPPLIDDLGQELMCRINAAAVVGPVNRLALALLATPRRALGAAELAQQIDLYGELLHHAPYQPQTTVLSGTGQQAIRQAETLGLVTRRRQVLGDIIQADERQTALLIYARNNVLHTLAIPALVACCFLNTPTWAVKDVLRLGELVYPFLRAVLFLPWLPDDLAGVLRTVLDALVKQGLLSRDRFGNRLQSPAAGTPAALRLRVLAGAVQSVFERFYITVALLLERGSGAISAAELEERSRVMAERLALLYGFEAPEFYDRTLFQIFIRTLRVEGLIWEDAAGRLAFVAALEADYQDARLLLSEPVRHSIRLLAKDTPSDS